jgi:hypothetical protein
MSSWRPVLLWQVDGVLPAFAMPCEGLAMAERMQFVKMARSLRYQTQSWAKLLGKRP